MLTSEPIINIRPIARHHGQFLVVLGVVVFVSVALLAQYFWQSWRLVIIFLFFVAGIILFIGVVKRLEPECSFTLTPSQIIYHHKYGKWQLKWENINAIVAVKNQHGLSQQELPYIGLTIKNYLNFRHDLSPRLANRLIHEQRPLIVYAVQHNLINFEQSLLNFSPYKINNEVIKGPIAAFFHQCETLKQAYGFDLYLPASGLDRELEAFAMLLRQCKACAKNYTKRIS